MDREKCCQQLRTELPKMQKDFWEFRRLLNVLPNNRIDQEGVLILRNMQQCIISKISEWQKNISTLLPWKYIEVVGNAHAFKGSITHISLLPDNAIVAMDYFYHAKYLSARPQSAEKYKEQDSHFNANDIFVDAHGFVWFLADDSMYRFQYHADGTRTQLSNVDLSGNDPIRKIIPAKDANTYYILRTSGEILFMDEVWGEIRVQSTNISGGDRTQEKMRDMIPLSHNRFLRARQILGGDQRFEIITQNLKNPLELQLRSADENLEQRLQTSGAQMLLLPNDILVLLSERKVFLNVLVLNGFVQEVHYPFFALEKDNVHAIATAWGKLIIGSNTGIGIYEVDRTHSPRLLHHITMASPATSLVVSENGDIVVGAMDGNITVFGMNGKK